MSQDMPRVVIGMDPHKRTATIEVMTADEIIVGGGQFTTDTDGYTAMRDYGRQWPERVWAVEGCEGIGRHIAQRLIADAEPVLDVPAKLSARLRFYATGQGRKTDDTDAHSITLVGVRMAGLRPVVAHEQIEILRLLVDRRREGVPVAPTAAGADPRRRQKVPLGRPGPSTAGRRAAIRRCQRHSQTGRPGAG